MANASENEEFRKTRKNKFKSVSMDILDPQVQPINRLEGIFKKG